MSAAACTGTETKTASTSASASHRKSDATQDCDEIGPLFPINGSEPGIASSREMSKAPFFADEILDIMLDEDAAHNDRFGAWDADIAVSIAENTTDANPLIDGAGKSLFRSCLVRTIILKVQLARNQTATRCRRQRLLHMKTRLVLHAHIVSQCLSLKRMRFAAARKLWWS